MENATDLASKGVNTLANYYVSLVTGGLQLGCIQGECDMYGKEIVDHAINEWNKDSKKTKAQESKTKEEIQSSLQKELQEECAPRVIKAKKITTWKQKCEDLKKDGITSQPPKGEEDTDERIKYNIWIDNKCAKPYDTLPPTGNAFCTNASGTWEPDKNSKCIDGKNLKYGVPVKCDEPLQKKNNYSFNCQNSKIDESKRSSVGVFTRYNIDNNVNVCQYRADHCPFNEAFEQSEWTNVPSNRMIGKTPSVAYCGPAYPVAVNVKNADGSDFKKPDASTLIKNKDGGTYVKPDSNKVLLDIAYDAALVADFGLDPSAVTGTTCETDPKMCTSWNTCYTAWSSRIGNATDFCDMAEEYHGFKTPAATRNGNTREEKCGSLYAKGWNRIPNGVSEYPNGYGGYPREAGYSGNWHEDLKGWTEARCFEYASGSVDPKPWFQAMTEKEKMEKRRLRQKVECAKLKNLGIQRADYRTYWNGIFSNQRELWIKNECDERQSVPKWDGSTQKGTAIDGISVQCTSNDVGRGSNAIYRYEDGFGLRHYPSTKIAASWDTTYNKPQKRDCIGMNLSRDMALNPNKPKNITDEIERKKKEEANILRIQAEGDILAAKVAEESRKTIAAQKAAAAAIAKAKQDKSAAAQAAAAAAEATRAAQQAALKEAARLVDLKFSEQRMNAMDEDECNEARGSWDDGTEECL